MANTLARAHQLGAAERQPKGRRFCAWCSARKPRPPITQKLAAEEVEQISFEIARMDRVSSEATDAVLIEWLDVMLAADSVAAGGVEFAREVMEQAFGAQKAQAMLKRDPVTDL